MKRMFRHGVGLWMMMALMPLISLFAKGEEPERVVPFPYGDMDHWVVREIHESGIIGRRNGSTSRDRRTRSWATSPSRTREGRRGAPPT